MALKIDYAVALTNLYGIVHKEKVLEIYNSQNREQIDLTEIEAIMDQDTLEEHFTYIDGNYFVHEAIIYFDESELYLEEKRGKPYYIPNKQQLLKYKDSEYFEKTVEYEQLHKLVKKHIQKDNVNSVEDICMDVVMHCQMDASPSKIINEMDRTGVSFSTQEELSAAVDVIANLSNHTRRWVNNGFTPRELFEQYEKGHHENKEESLNQEDGTIQPIRKGEKVGRNEPCPCGSGKKYKKCCL